MNQNDPVQIRIKGRHIIQEGRVRDGQVIWAKRENAELYIKQGIAEPALGAIAGPSETKPAGPSETQDISGAEKKSFGAATDILSTDSQRSSEPGTDQQSSVSAPDRVSGVSSATTSGRRGKRGER